MHAGRVQQITSSTRSVAADDAVYPQEDKIEASANGESQSESEPLVNRKETLPAARVSIGDNTDYTSDIMRKSGDPLVYKYYFASAGWLQVSWFVISLVVWIFCTEFPSESYFSALSAYQKSLTCMSAIWIKWWSEANAVHPNQDVGMYMGVFVVLGITGILMVLSICW
jgi:hypothetical protein